MQALRLSPMRLAALCLLALPACADDPPDPSRIVGRAVAILDMNWEDSLAYTWKEKRIFENSVTGRPTRRHSMTYEADVLEGFPFFKLIEKEDQPLSGYEKKQALERMRDEAEKRRNPKFRLFEKHPMEQYIPYSRLADDFDLKLAEEDSRRWVFTGRPKYQGPHPRPSDPDLAAEFWIEIDRAESQIVRLEFKRNFRNLRGITTVMVRQKAVDHVWMWTLVQNIYPPHNRALPHFPRPRLQPIQTGWQTEYIRSDFGKR